MPNLTVSSSCPYPAVEETMAATIVERPASKPRWKSRLLLLGRLSWLRSPMSIRATSRQTSPRERITATSSCGPGSGEHHGGPGAVPIGETWFGHRAQPSGAPGQTLGNPPPQTVLGPGRGGGRGYRHGRSHRRSRGPQPPLRTATSHGRHHHRSGFHVAPGAPVVTGPEVL